MSGRCKSCNRVLSEHEIKINEDNILEELCNSCKGSIYDFYSYTDDHQFEHEGLEEGMSVVKNTID